MVRDPFLAAAGAAPARGREALWRQLALLGVAAATSSGARARTDLAATLLALDAPVEAARLVAPSEGAWARWWGVLAAGQRAGADGLPAALAAALAGPPAAGPDEREVRRRLGDLADELAAVGVPVPGADAARARFALDGHRERPRRVLLAGRSSAAFLVEPRWDELRLVRLAPSQGPAAGNRAQLRIDEVVASARRGEAGPGRAVPDDEPSGLDPQAMLEALREDPVVRDRRLIALATEVREERALLARERARLEEERAQVLAERARLRRMRPALAAVPPAPARLPRSDAEARALLGLAADATRAEVERRYRAEVARCHPDRVDGLHPEIRRRAQDLTVALNAARDLLLGRARPGRSARR